MFRQIMFEIDVGTIPSSAPLHVTKDHVRQTLPEDSKWIWHGLLKQQMKNDGLWYGFPKHPTKNHGFGHESLYKHMQNHEFWRGSQTTNENKFIQFIMADSFKQQ